MKLIGELKKQVESTNTKEEAKDVIANAGMELTDDELNDVVGGSSRKWLCERDGHNFGGSYWDESLGKEVHRCITCGYIEER